MPESSGNSGDRANEPRTEEPSSTELLSANAKHILGEMLGIGTGWAGTEGEGDCIGPYRLCEMLGAGGFGNVWRAEQTQPIRREVALKIIKLGMDTMQVLGRFEQERQALASMDHPSIASMLDAGAGPGGRPYFAMELVRGTPITQWCQEHSASLHQRLQVFQQVCQAVQHAHQKGIIHRDLKPSNILVTEIDGQPVPKVIDFGIAKAIHTDSPHEHTLLTQADQVLGTPRFMSPEQIEGSAAVDTRSDIYSLGVVLYKLLTGVPPFDPRLSAGELKRLVQKCSPPRPSTQIRRRPAADTPALAMLADDYSNDLDWITMRALERDPARRYQTAAELAGDIQRFLNSEPVVARPPSLGYVARRWIKRNRRSFAAACFVLLSMVAGTGVALWQAQAARLARRSAERETELARAAEKQAHGARREAQHTATFLLALLDRISLEASQGRNAEALKAALASSDHDILELEAGPELRIQLLDKIQGIYSTIGEIKLAIPLAALKAREIAALQGATSAEAFAAELSHLKMVVNFGARATAPALLEDLRKRVENAKGRDNKLWMDVQRELSRAWMKLDIPDKALAAAEELMDETRRQKLTPQNSLGNEIALAAALEFAGRYDEALSLLETARRHTTDPGHFSRIDERVLFLLQRQGDFKRGAELARASLADLKKKPDTQARDIISLLFLLAELESRNDEHGSAISHSEEALEIARAQLSGSAPASLLHYKDVFQALLNISEYESEAGNFGDALPHADEAFRLARKVNNDQMITRSLQGLCDIHQAAGKLDEACDFLRQIHDRILDSGANLREGEKALSEICNIRRQQNRPEEALKLGMELWTEIRRRPEASEDVIHLGSMARIILASYDALKKARPETPAPQELAEWKNAVAAAAAAK
ncbi:MAG: serine/threonine-protein kinase [Verrucomicrobiota bacterium]